jgi:hypothetical protein
VATAAERASAWATERICRGDSARDPFVNGAIAAMATAPRWPILRQMARQGGWTQVLVGYAKAMPAGTWAGRPGGPDVASGLGCTERA